MADSNPVSKTVSALQSAYGLTKSIADLNEAQAIKAQIGELQTQILAAQESALASQAREADLSRRINELEQRITEFETWDAEKQRYQLRDFGGGTFAYTLKEGMENDEPPHQICPNCFQNKQRSILQGRGRDAFNRDMYKCPSCGTDFNFGERGDQQVIKTRGRGDWTRR